MCHSVNWWLHWALPVQDFRSFFSMPMSWLVSHPHAQITNSSFRCRQQQQDKEVAKRELLALTLIILNGISTARFSHKYRKIAMAFGMLLLGVVISVLVPLVLKAAWQTLEEKWWRPKKLAAALRAQGIRGPPPAFMAGNLMQLTRIRDAEKVKDMPNVSHDIVGHVLPEFSTWSQQFGKPYVYWAAHEPRTVVSDPEIVREILSKRVERFEKSKLQRVFITDFIGYGLVGVNGDEWAYHRRVVSPAFHLQRLKGMVGSITSCTAKLVESWEKLVANGESEVEITESITTAAADIISHTAFGSNYQSGHRVFEGLGLLAAMLVTAYRYAWLPFSRYYPTILHLRIWKLRREMDGILLRLIKERRSSVKSGRSPSFGNDLLGLMLEESDRDDHKSRFDDQILVDECKTFYLAGHETTASLLVWTMLLLAMNPDWQKRARAEVQQFCKNGFEDGDVLSKLKVVGMILNETLRLYSPAVEIQRASFGDTMLNNLAVPNGMGVSVPILAIHHDPELWGPDANEFNPERFAEGVAKACKHPNGFMPFSFGPRVCIGQSFALIEVKIALAMILQKFKFRLSPKYRHNPVLRVVLKPKHGLPLILEKL